MAQSADDKRPLHVERVTPAHWRVTFDDPPVNVATRELLHALDDVVTAMDADDAVRVVVFDSADPDFFLAHFDMLPPTDPTAPQPDWLGLSRRISRSDVVSIAAIRGRCRGIGNEFALACDMRFASREKAVLGQPEVGAGVTPTGGGTEHLPLLIGRGRALEAILGADDFDADTAERYGWINRALPDSELDAFVARLASHIASFDREPLAAAKALVNRRTLPSEEDLGEGLTAFRTSLTWPGTRARIGSLFQAGLQQRGDVEYRLADHIAQL